MTFTRSSTLNELPTVNELSIHRCFVVEYRRKMYCGKEILFFFLLFLLRVNRGRKRKNVKLVFQLAIQTLFALSLSFTHRQVDDVYRRVLVICLRFIGYNLFHRWFVVETVKTKTYGRLRLWVRAPYTVIMRGTKYHSPLAIWKLNGQRITVLSWIVELLFDDIDLSKCDKIILVPNNSSLALLYYYSKIQTVDRSLPLQQMAAVSGLA